MCLRYRYRYPYRYLTISVTVTVTLTVTITNNVSVLVNKWIVKSAKEVTCVWLWLTRKFVAVHLVVLVR